MRSAERALKKLVFEAVEELVELAAAEPWRRGTAMQLVAFSAADAWRNRALLMAAMQSGG